MKSMLIFLFWIISFLVNSQVAHYVKNGGNDDSTGLSDEQAWATIKHVNSQTFIPGDSILFKSGDTWVVTQIDGSDMLRIRNYSGTKDNPITYGAYGTEAKPIITGKQSVTGWVTPENWTDDGGNVWHMTTDIISNVMSFNNRGRLWLNGTEAQKAESVSTPTATFPWTHNRQVLYVYAISNPSSYYSNIESIGVTNSVMLCYMDFITIQNLDFRGSATVTQLIGADNCIVENCNIGMHSGMTGLHSTTSTNIIIRGNIFDTGDMFNDTYIFNNTEEGLYVSDGCSNWDIYGNTIINWSHTNFNIQLNDPTFPIKDIKFHNNFLTAPDVDYGRGFTYNVRATGYGTCTNNEIYDNYFYDHPVSNQISGDGLKFYNNIIDLIRGAIYRTDRSATGLLLNSYFGLASNNKIYNNVIMNCRDNGIFIRYTTNTLQNNLIKNNIIFNNGTGGTYPYQIRYELSPGYIFDNTFQNNLVFKAGENDLIFYEKMAFSLDRPMTVKEFNEMNGTTKGLIEGEMPDVISGNIDSLPKFIGGLPFDYHLAAGSPAIGSGIYVNLEYDYDGKLYNNPPSIGAHEGNPRDTPVPSTQVIVLYPNPSSGYINVLREGGSLKTQIFKIISISGKILYEDILEEGVTTTQFQINLISGIYLVQILSSANIMNSQSLLVIN